MNTQIFTPFIILTNNPEISENFARPQDQFTSFTQFLAKVEELFDEEEFIVLTSENTEILNFEFNLEGNQAESPPPNCTLEFIDKLGTFDLNIVRAASKLKVGSDGTVDTPKTVFYCAFGLGDDLTYWSNFNAMTLMSAATFQKPDQPKTIQLNFGVCLGYHEAFKAVLNKVINSNILGSLNFNSKGVIEKIYGSEYEKTTKAKRQSTTGPLTLKSMNFQKNSDLVSSYLLGFNQADGVMKNVINTFLRSIFAQQLNVFFVCDDLRKMFLKSEASTLNNIKKQRRFGNTSGVRIHPDFQNFVNKFTTDLRDELDLDIALMSKDVSNYTHKFKFEVRNQEGDKNTVEEKREKIEAKLQKLFSGLSRQTGVGNDKCILVRETDKRLITLFHNLLTDNAKKELPINPNLPIVFLGEEKLIRSILYGDLFETNEITNNEYPRNEEAFTYLNQSWKSLDFYGNNPTQEDIQTLEKRLAEVAKPFSPKVRYDNFPIFRYNTTNSNVTDISSEENNMYYSLLYTGLTEYPKIYDQYKANEEEIKLKELAVKTRISISLAESLSFYIDRRTEKSFKLKNLSLEEYKKLKALVKKVKGDYELVLKFVEYLLENDIQLDAEINEDLLKDIPFFEEFSEYSIQSLILIAKTVVELLNNDEKDPSLPTVNIREKLQAIKNQQDFIDSGVSLDGTKLILDPTITYYDLFNFIDQIPIQVEITTLPFFRISNFFWLGYPCLLFANRPDLISSNNLDPLDSYLTGAYIINSVKHKISNDRCESIFTLTKYSEGVKAKTANVNG